MKNNKTSASNKKIIIDERQQKSVGNISTLIVILAIIYLLVEITYKYITTKDILTTSWEIVLLMLMSIVFSIGMKLNKEINLPTSFLGRTLPTDTSKESKQNRMKSYLLKAFAFSTALTLITLFFTFFIVVEEKLSAIQYIGEFFGLFIVYIIFSYISGEYNIKKYNKYMKSLDN